MAPELKTIAPESTGVEQHELRSKYYAAACSFCRKLICSFFPKIRYVVFGHMLCFYLDRRMKLTKIHRRIKFTANPYLEQYIDNNSNKRNQFKKYDVTKSFYKLMTNFPYGKTIENAARRSDIRLLNDPEKARKLAENQLWVDFRVFDESLIGIEMSKCRHFINKLFQHGFCVLEWRKYKMYTFYAKLKDVFGERVRMLYTDTDSFFLQFIIEDLEQELNRAQSIRDWFDFFEISVDQMSRLKAPSDPHGGVVAYFKDEIKGEQVYELIALKPKSNLVRTIKATMYKPDGEMQLPVFLHKAVAEGITRANIKRLTLEDNRQMHNEVASCRNVISRRIGTKLHQVKHFHI